MNNAPSYFIIDKDTGFVFYNNPYCTNNWCFVNPHFVPNPLFYAPPIFTKESSINTINMLIQEGYNVDLKDVGEFEKSRKRL